ENTVVFNSTRKGQWLQEERTKMPFRQGHVYTLEFIANNGRIQVLLNGNAFFEFVERLPSSHIRSIEIAGDVHVHSAQIL
ncbi:Galectin, partial [Trichostrongylus colubriformis]